MSSIFAFGEHLDGYQVKVLYERTVRAGAGIVFFFAIVSFMHAWLVGNFQPTRLFVVAFLLDFTIRIFVNPRYAPSLLVGQWFVRKQQPEYVGAPQKRFAWAIGLAPAAPLQAGAAPTLVAALDPAEAERRKVPKFAKALGHEEKWKLHHRCK